MKIIRIMLFEFFDFFNTVEYFVDTVSQEL